MNSIVVDCGANVGRVLEHLVDFYPTAIFHAFEPNPNLHAQVRTTIERFSDVKAYLHKEAVWVSNGTIPLYLDHDISSTLLRNKRSNSRWPPIDYSRFIMVPCIDFGQWLQHAVRPEDQVIVKMDIEGAEYEVLEHLVKTDAINLIDILYIEWHYKKFPELSVGRHKSLVCALRERVDLRPWG